MVRAAVDDLTTLVPPVLREVQRASVLTFVEEHGSYALQGGKQRVRQCMSSDTLSVLKLMGVQVEDTETDTDKAKEQDDDRFVEEIQALFAPKSADDAYASLEAVVMKQKATVEAAAIYIAKFQKAVKLAQVTQTLKAKRIRKTFEAGIKPASLAKLVAQEECDTWEESAGELVKHAREREAVDGKTRRYTEQDEGSGRAGPRGQPPRSGFGQGGGGGNGKGGSGSS